MKLSEVNLSSVSPMMQQYASVKQQYPNHIVFFRIGDFYEMFFEDAIIVSSELQLTLTGKDCGLDSRAPMCGVPHHAVDVYLKKLIDKGYNVVICEQTSDPATSKGLVTRDVVRIVTPGTLIENDLLDDEKNNYLCSILMDDNDISISFADISTGEVYLISVKSDISDASIIDILSGYSPVEVLIPNNCKLSGTLTDFITKKLNSSLQILDDCYYDYDNNESIMLEQFNASSCEEIGVLKDTIDALNISALFKYISNNQKCTIGRFTKVITHRNDSVMKIGFTARRNLELCETMRNREKKGTLLWVLDYAKTSMGKRLLKSIIEQPLVVPSRIIDRLDAVEQLKNNSVDLSEITECLSGVYDLERLMTRIMYKTATPRDMKSLALTAEKLPEIKNHLYNYKSKLLNKLNDSILLLDDIKNLVDNSIIEDPPINLKDGGVIKEGFNSELDSLRSIINGGNGSIESIEEKERERTGIKNLKIGYNRVFGYYIEVTKSYYDMVPDYYIRKQTLTNCERFITEELKSAENTILGAKEKIINLESEIFNEIRDFISTKLNDVTSTAGAIAMLDVLCSFANVAIKNNYTKPEIAIDGIIDIRNGRHPVVELMQTQEMFVPNDTYLDLTDNKMLLITGPNMSGKSTYMRQVALITLMAQIGSFVPCDYAKISIVDQIFTRVGASDDLTSGQSTFMVEMCEVAEIVSNATKNSLVILDEVGRGTSTFDGLSIARAVCEYIVNTKRLGCRTLFATHYHELIELENTLQGVKNYSVAVKQRGDTIKFLRKIVRGGVDESYGIEVAKLAGLPSKITKRAKELLDELESENKVIINNNNGVGQVTFENINESIVSDKLRKTNIDEMSDDDLRYFVKELLKYVK